MSRLRPEQLHVHFTGNAAPDGPTTPRRYTLTHSDATGDLFLTIGSDYNQRQITGWYTRLMRDEVLAEWNSTEAGMSLEVYCHVSGGFAVGPAGWRYSIFQHELPLVLTSFRYGDRALYEAYPELDAVPIKVHFGSHRRRYRRTEHWKSPADYRLGSP